MINNFSQAEGFWLTKGDKVRLKKELEAVGTVLSVDLDCYPLNVYGVTTAQILWDDAGGVPDIQWTNKLEKVEEQ
jgi:hypothetical protein